MSDRRAAPILVSGPRRAAALAIVVLLSLAVLVLLPVAVQSLWHELRGAAGLSVYDLATGEPLAAGDGDGQDRTYLDIVVSGIDEARLSATLTVTGHRICSAQCPPVTVVFFSLRADDGLRRGMPYTVAIEAPTESGPVTREIELPISGRPPLYPFDRYHLELGMGAQVTMPDGRTISPTLDLMSRVATITVEDGVARMSMARPTPLDAARYVPRDAPIVPASALDLTFQRPIYLQVITVLLVLLIAVSGFFALATQSLGDLSLGLGGLILGVWGIRSVVIQGNLPDITVVDSVLAIIILLMLLGVAIRVALAIRTAPREGPTP